MFYSASLLWKEGPLHSVWLAAFFEKRLSRRQVDAVDISRSVDKILPANLAYRTIAQLMLGIVRIFSKKVEYLFHDCNEAVSSVEASYQTGKPKGKTKPRVVTSHHSVKQTKDAVLVRAEEECSIPQAVEIMRTITGHPSFTIPKSFELDAFDLEINDETYDGPDAHQQEDTTRDEWEGNCTLFSFKQFRQSEASSAQDLTFDCATPIYDVLQLDLSSSSEYISDIFVCSRKRKKPERDRQYTIQAESNQDNYQESLDTRVKRSLGQELTQAASSNNLDTASLMEEAHIHINQNEMDGKKGERASSVDLKATEPQEFEHAANSGGVGMTSPCQRTDECITVEQEPDFPGAHQAATSNVELNIALRPANISSMAIADNVTMNHMTDEPSVLVETVLSVKRKSIMAASVDEIVGPGDEFDAGTTPHKFKTLASLATSPELNIKTPPSVDSTPKFKVKTPARSERPRVSKKRRTLYDETIVLSNETLRDSICDASRLVTKRRKAPHTLLDVWKDKKINHLNETFVEPLFCLPPLLQTLSCGENYKYLLQAQESRSPKIDGFRSPRNDIDGCNIELKDLRSETEVCFNSYQGTSDVLLNSGDEAELFRDGDDESTNHGAEWSTRTRKVAEFLHSRFLKSKNERNSLSLLEILEGKTRSTCAKMFYETLMLKVHGCISVAQESPYADIAISATPLLEGEFGRRSGSR